MTFRAFTPCLAAASRPTLRARAHAPVKAGMLRIPADS
jgi:hypothetical protein